jgi:hypothetical protein
MARQFLGNFRKQPSEELDYFVDYTNWLASGETISTTVLTHTPTTSPDLVLGAPATADNIVIGYRVSGGLSGTQYQVTVRSTASDGQVVEREVLHNVEEF